MRHSANTLVTFERKPGEQRAKSFTILLKEDNDDLVLRDDFSEEADRAFQLGHMLALHALHLQAQHFGEKSIEAAVETAIAHYQASWPRPTSREA